MMIIKNKIYNFFSELNCNDNKIVYLIYLLPIALLAGNLIINLTTLLIMLLFISELFQKKKIKFILNKIFFYLILIFSYLVLNSIFFSENKIDSIDQFNKAGLISALGFLRFIFLAFALAYYFNLDNGRYENKIFNFWKLIFYIVTFDIIFEFFFGFNTIGFSGEEIYHHRIASFTGDELIIGGFYYGFILIAVSCILKNNSKKLYLYLILFVITSILIGEKSNYIRVFFITSLFLFFISTLRIKKILLSIIFLFLTLVSTVNFNQSLRESFVGKLPLFKQARTILHAIYPNLVTATDVAKVDGFFRHISQNRHIKHQFTAYEMFQKNKFFGIGLKNFRNWGNNEKYNTINSNISVKYTGKSILSGMGGSTHPHQFHMQILSELGLIGYILILFLIIYFIVKGFTAFRAFNDYRSLVGVLFLISTVLPLFPSGSFFSTYNATIFWINFSLILKYIMKDFFLEDSMHQKSRSI